jgi:hypothetical protein
MIIYPNSRRIATNQGSLNFNGFSNNGNGLYVANNLSQFGLSQQSFTVTMWIYIPYGYQTNDTMALFNFGSSGTAGVLVNMSTYNPVQVVVYCDGNYTPGPDLAIGWNFVAYTGNGTTGIEYARSPQTAFSSVTVTNSTATGGAGTNLVCGNSVGLNNSMYVGYMSDMKLYNYPKTQAELMVESRQRQPISKRGLKSYLPLRNVGSMQNDVFNNIQWTLNGTRSNFLNSLQGSPAPEVATVRRARFLSHAAASQSHLYMTMGVGS